MKYLGDVSFKFEDHQYKLWQAVLEPFTQLGPATSHKQKWWAGLRNMPGISEIHYPDAGGQVWEQDLPKILADPSVKCAVTFKVRPPLHKVFNVESGSVLVLANGRLFKRMTWADAGMQRPSDRAYNALRIQRKKQWIVYLTPLGNNPGLHEAMAKALFGQFFG